PSGQAALAEYCAGRGFRPRAVTDFLQFAAAWQPGLKLICLSLPLASTDGIEAIRFLAEHRCEAGLVLTSDADPRVLSAASRLARARGLRVIGALSQPFNMAQIGALLLHPEPELDPETLVLSVQMARDDLREC